MIEGRRATGLLHWVLVVSFLSALACTRKQEEDSEASELDAGLDTKTAVLPSSHPPVPRGMVWIEPGALIAGTPPASVPRKADQEMAGEQVVLDGFFIDQFAFPNEEGAIPRTTLTRAEAQKACEKRGKRLCTELEWERACKGPTNSTYEYGNRYQPSICKTGAPSRALPSGYQFSCRSEFDVHDMHGAIWEWTASDWGRGSKQVLASVRGGNGPDGDVVGRCANARSVPPSTAEPNLGFRCCSGARNTQEVNLSVVDGPPLRLINMPDKKLMRAMEGKLPESVASDMKQRGVFRMVRLWEWRPIANEDLLVVGGCAGAPPRRECGVLVVRRTLGKLDVLDWVGSGHFIPTVKLEHEPRKVWIYGGDRTSHYRKGVVFDWGRVVVEPPMRNVKGG